MKRKLDSNDSKITSALREHGCVVWHLDCKEPGRPDKLVAFLGELYLLEIKTPKTGRVSAEQKIAHAEMARAGIRVHVVKTVREALEAVGAWGEGAEKRRQGLAAVASLIVKAAQHPAASAHGALRSSKRDYSSSRPSWADAWEPESNPTHAGKDLSKGPP